MSKRTVSLHLFTLMIVLICNQAKSFAQTRTYDVAAYDAYHASEAKNFRQAAEYQMEAGRLKGNDGDFYFYAAIWYAIGGDSNEALRALEAAADAGMVDVQKVTSNPELTALRSDARWKALISRMEVKQQALSAILKAPQLRDELLRMWANDQSARTLWVKKQRELKVEWSSPQLAVEYNKIYETDAYNTRRIREIVKTHGWPAIPIVGRDGAYAAWALVQHSDDVAFQEICLALMKAALERKELNPEEYAELFDRIRRNKYEKQLYGTAVCGKPAGGNEFCPIADEGNLDRRRKQLGLEPSTVSARLEGFIYLPISVAEARKRDALNQAQARNLVEQSRRAFRERKFAESKSLFSRALRYFGDVSAGEIYNAAVRFASVSEDREQYVRAVFTLFNILLNKGKLTRAKLLNEEAFKSLRQDKRWKELMSRLGGV